MADVEEEKEQSCPQCLPPWLATFADLMSLLMCFFVLLLSFSEMDVIKFKQLAGSMREAFGVQNQVKARDIPKGTSIIATEFSPGRPEPTPLNEVRQFTTQTVKSNLDVKTEQGKSDYMQDDSGSMQEKLKQVQAEEEEARKEQEKEEAIAMATSILKVLSKEVKEGSVEVETQEGKVIIRVKEKGSFYSGSAELNYDFIPVMAKIRDLLLNVESQVSIEGHTDNVPITTDEFTSNWDLSTARALSVARELFADGRIDQRKYRVTGFADTKPLAPNDTALNRALNRRVEIIIQKGKDEELLNRLPSLPEGAEQESSRLAPSEIF